MSSTRRIVTLMMFALCAANSLRAVRAENPAAPDAAAPALAIIDQALTASKARPPVEQLATLRAAAASLPAELPQNVLIAEVLASAQILSQSAEQAGDLRKSVKAVQQGLSEARDILRFRVVNEEPQPEGFPPITPVGEIRVKQYPAYRLARAKSNGDSAFWTLFRHIQKNDIAMTAPVEMTYQPTEQAAPAAPDGKAADTEPIEARSIDMAFLYRGTQQGRLGADGAVAVSDVAPLTAVSIGLRGPSGPREIAAARKRLERWLAEHAKEYQVAGSLRVLGFNSPMVTGKRRYFEVEIPITKVANDNDAAQ